MNRKALVGIGAVIAVLVLVASMVGGGGGGEPDRDRSGAGGAAGATDHDGTAGSGPQARITVIAVYRGTPPLPKKVRLTPECGPHTWLDTPVLVRPEDGALANVVVRAVDGVPLDGRGSGIGVEIVQEQCEYLPRVATMLLGQDVRITSRDSFLHNVHSFSGSDTLFNKGQPVPSSFVREAADLPDKEGPITFKCDVHPWMISTVFASRTPYVGVTGESGTATLLTPPGELTLEAWHETLGTKRQTVTATADAPVSVTFEFP